MSELDAYYAEAQRWLQDERRKDRRRARAMGWLAAAAVGVAGVMATALVVAMPLKRTEPYVVRVDASSGVVDIVPRYVGEADLPEAVLRHLLGEYVTRRERYIAPLAETDYEETGAFHTAVMNEAPVGTQQPRLSAQSLCRRQSGHGTDSLHRVSKARRRRGRSPSALSAHRPGDRGRARTQR